MKLAVLKERRTGERRVAATPETVKKLAALGFEATVESGAGQGASISDEAFRDAGAEIGADLAQTLANAELVLKVQRPEDEEIKAIPRNAVLVALLEPLQHSGEMEKLAQQMITAFAMELVPRITRAQTMDVLSSQANLAGYKAVIDAAAAYGRAMPMMMTAAGTVSPAKIMVMGAGVAGLQAIATAKRLGGVVSATDVRPAVKEQVESLGAKFVAVEDEEFREAETAGGYAKEMSAEYQKKQNELIAEEIKKQDIVITTALIPGRPAPKLISADMVASMKPGAVIVDLATVTGGNCELSEHGKTVEKHGVTIIGPENLPAQLADTSSALYARNLLAFVTPLVDAESKSLRIDREDDIVKGALVCIEGRIVHPALSAEEPAPTPEQPAAEADSGTATETAAAGAAASEGEDDNG
jgi:NAD(P) transhydrogenase subunit alpha